MQRLASPALDFPGSVAVVVHCTGKRRARVVQIAWARLCLVAVHVQAEHARTGERIASA